MQRQARQPTVGFYCYGYCDPESFDPFYYIGKGHDGRAWQHLSDHSAGTPFHNKVASMLCSSRRPEIEIIEDGLIESDAFALERNLICFYGRKDLGLGPLLNLSDGGEGPSGYCQSQAQRENSRRITTERNIGNKYGVGRVDPRRKPIVGRSRSSDYVRFFPSILSVTAEGYHRITIQNALKSKDNWAFGLLWSHATPEEIAKYGKETTCCTHSLSLS